MLNEDDLREVAVTFDDVLLEPQYSEAVPSEVDVRTRLTRNITLNIPLISAPMDTVTESKLAIALAQEGGVGVVHKNLTIDQQAEEVAQVKRSANGIIRNPITVEPNVLASEVDAMMDAHHISGVPVLDSDKRVVGIVTKRDLRFVTNLDVPVREFMTSDPLVMARGRLTLDAADMILKDNKVEKLLLVDEDQRLTGMITIRDVDLARRYPNSCKDDEGRLRVGASVGVRDFERVERLVGVDVDFIVVDSAHGHSRNVMETIQEIKRQWNVDVIAGNVATAEGARALIEAGADAVKVGIGPGSICTTRVVSGVGVPQITAVGRASRVAEEYGVPIIADGGVRYSGDVVKALAAGASVVMLGGLFAGLEESPGEMVLYQGRYFKSYRGMGSLGAMARGSSDRYFQKGKAIGKLVPEGVEGRVPYKGNLSNYVYQLVGGVRAGMGYCGAKTIDELRKNAKFVRISPAAVRENHPHDISITQEAPNYSSCGANL